VADRQPKTLRPGNTHADAEATREFQRQALSLLEEGENELIVDLSDIRVMESIFLGALVAIAHSLRASGGNMRMCCAHVDVRAILQLSGIDRLIELHPAVPDAARRFSEDREAAG
jgi:anti-anti-sigma factor